jgi:hypothetical protein
MSMPSSPGPVGAGAPVTLAQARAALAELRPRLSNLLRLRADLAELRADLAASGGSALGGMAEAKGLEARLYAELERLAATGAQVKGYAPLLLDWPGVRAGVPVLWCWLEGEADVEWYHRLDCGFPGRRPVSLADDLSDELADEWPGEPPGGPDPTD